MNFFNQFFRPVPFLPSWVWLLLITSTLFACRPQTSPNGIAPTQNPLFSNSEETPDSVILNPSITSTPYPTRLPTATYTPIPTPLPTKQPPPPIVLYDDTLNKDWELRYSTIPYDIEYGEHVYAGTKAILLQPKVGRQRLFFTVKENASRQYLRDDILGLTFQLQGREAGVGPKDWGVFIVGSDQYPYYRLDDNSIDYAGYDPVDLITALEFLGINSTIPQNEWVWITDWLNERIFDPPSQYIVGFFIMNDDEYLKDIVIDEINLELYPPEQRRD